MYKAGDEVVNRRGDRVTLVDGDMKDFPIKYLLDKVYLSCAEDGRYFGVSETEYDIVGYHQKEPDIKYDTDKDVWVDNPPHYTRLSPEPIDVINSWKLNFNRGNAIKYIARAGHKDNEIQDLEKAIYYLQDEVKRLRNVG